MTILFIPGLYVGVCCGSVEVQCEWFQQWREHAEPCDRLEVPEAPESG